jgi:probable rRNA maturation factor
MMVEVFFEDIEEVPGVNPEFLFAWYSNVCDVESKVLGDISIIFCSDEHLLEMNKEYLEHDYYTDIITFDYTQENVISGDLFISVDRVQDNANEFDTLFQNELHRVCVHGLLHLCGYKDKSGREQELMRLKENEMLELRKFHVEHLG